METMSLTDQEQVSEALAHLATNPCCHLITSSKALKFSLCPSDLISELIKHIFPSNDSPSMVPNQQHQHHLGLC